MPDGPTRFHFIGPSYIGGTISVFSDKCECVMEVVTRFFGNYSSIKREKFFPATDEIILYF